VKAFIRLHGTLGKSDALDARALARRGDERHAVLPRCCDPLSPACARNPAPLLGSTTHRSCGPTELPHAGTRGEHDGTIGSIQRRPLLSR
jgi:hypothetical protein